MNTQRVEGHTPTPWTKIGHAKRTLFTTAHGQQKIEPDKAFIPVEILTCLRHAEQAQVDCDFVQYAVNNIERLEKVNEALVRACEQAIQGLEEIWLDNESPLRVLQEAVRLAKEPA